MRAAFVVTPGIGRENARKAKEKEKMGEKEQKEKVKAEGRQLVALSVAGTITVISAHGFSGNVEKVSEMAQEAKDHGKVKAKGHGKGKAKVD